MPRSYLQLRFDNAGDGTGELLARAESGGFAGEGGAYFSAAEVEAFALALAAFPEVDQPRPTLAGGFWNKNTSGELDQELLGLAVYPINKRGYVGMQVRIATDLGEGDRPEAKKVVRLEIVTTYEPLNTFGKELIALARGSRKEAVLEGEGHEKEDAAR